jgi:hypothetical protein
MASRPEYACHFVKSVSLIHVGDVLDNGDRRYEIENFIAERETLSTPNHKLALRSIGGRELQHTLGGIYSYRHDIAL